MFLLNLSMLRLWRLFLGTVNHVWSCCRCRAGCWCYRGIHQYAIAGRADAVEDINYTPLRSISPQFSLLLHACPITFLTAHYKGQGDTLLTKERNTNWNIFCVSNMSRHREICSLHFPRISGTKFIQSSLEAVWWTSNSPDSWADVGFIRLYWQQQLQHTQWNSTSHYYNYYYYI